MVLCQGKENNPQVDRKPAAIIIDNPVKEGNVERMLSIMLAQCRVSLIILFLMLFVVGLF